jgi:hypothetical protein
VKGGLAFSTAAILGIKLLVLILQGFKKIQSISMGIIIPKNLKDLINATESVTGGTYDIISLFKHRKLDTVF